MRALLPPLLVFCGALGACKINEGEGGDTDTGVFGSVAGGALARFDDDLHDCVRARGAGVELCATRSAAEVTAGDDLEQLRGRLHNFLLEWRGVDSTLRVLTQL